MRRKRYFYLVLSLLIITAFLVFINSNYFLLNRVLIEGNDLLSTQEVLSFAELDENKNIFQIDFDRISSNLMSVSQIQGVLLERNLPATLKVVINERQPLGVLADGEIYLLIDQEGWILAEFNQLSETDYPLLLEIEASRAGKQVELKSDLEIALRYLAGIDKGYLTKADKIEIDNEEQVILSFVNSAQIIFGQAIEIDYKLRIFNRILSEVDIEEVDYLNLTYYNNPVLKLR